VIRLFGVTEEGNSVAAYVHNFTAYFYAHVDRACEFTEVELMRFKNQLCSLVQAPKAIVQIEQTQKFSIMHYQDKP
jgi:DNA polymerase elongation subunit (family B)